MVLLCVTNVGPHGCDINIADTNGCTPLIAATHVDVLKLLLGDKSCDIAARSFNGMTALRAAIIRQDVEAVKLLLSFASCPVNGSDLIHYTPLNMAVICRNSAIVKAMLTSTHAENIDVNAYAGEGEWQCTPLHQACLNGDIEIVRDILTTGRAHINVKTSKGCTPLHVACISGHADVAALLALHESCDVNAQDYDGTTPLHFAVDSCGNIDTTRALMSCNRIKPNMRNSLGFTPLDVATMLDKAPIAELLLSHRNWKADSGDMLCQ